METRIHRMIQDTEKKLIELLDSTIAEYEKLFSIKDEGRIIDYMEQLREHAENNSQWTTKVYGHTVQTGLYLSGVAVHLEAVESKKMSLKKYGYLGFEDKQLTYFLEQLRNLNRTNLVEDESIALLAGQAEKKLPRDTFEYRTLRILCISKYLKLYNVTNIFANLIYTQEAISEKHTISLSPDMVD